jgi:hypothetical protein
MTMHLSHLEIAEPRHILYAGVPKASSPHNILREDQKNFGVILPLALGLESDSDSDSSDDDLVAHTAVLEYMSTLHSYWMRLHAMLAAGELNFRELAELSLKCMQSMHHVQSMQLIHFLSEVEDEPKFDLFEVVMDARRALELDIEITEQRRYVATRKYPPIHKTSGLMVGVKTGTIVTGNFLHMSYRSLMWLHAMIKDDTVFISTGPRKQAESLDQLIVFLQYVAT